MTLHILAPDDPALAAYAEALAQDDAPDMMLNIIPFADYRAALDDALNAKRSTHEIIFVPGHLWIPELAHASKLRPLNDLLMSLPDEAATYDALAILPSVVEDCRYGDAQYMLPLFTDGHLLYYNPNLVPIDGDTVSPSNLLPLARAAAEKDNEIVPIALKAHPAEIFLDFLPYLLDAGASLLDGDSNPAFNNERGIAALENYIALSDFAPIDTHRYGNEEIAAALQHGDVAMAVSWGGQAAPIYLSETSAAPETYKTVTLSTPWNTTWGAALPTNIPDDAARAALAALLKLNGPSLDERVTRLAGSPVRRTSYTPQAYEQYPWLAAQRHMLDSATMLPKLPEIGAVLGALYDNVYQAFRGKKTAADALADAERAVNEALNG